MFGKRWRVDRSARSTGGVDVFRTCAIPPTGAFGFGFGQQRVRPIHRCAQQSEPVSPTRRSSRPCTFPITLRPNRSTCRGCVTRRSSDSTVLPARTVATRPAPTFTCCPPRGLASTVPRALETPGGPAGTVLGAFPPGHPLTGLRSIRMIADPNAVRSPALAANTATATPLRLRLDPNRPAEPYLGGAWWPR